jgi:hypothetical protein
MKAMLGRRRGLPGPLRAREWVPDRRRGRRQAGRRGGLHGLPRWLRPPGDFLRKEKKGGNFVRERRGD